MPDSCTYDEAFGPLDPNRHRTMAWQANFVDDLAYDSHTQRLLSEQASDDLLIASLFGPISWQVDAGLV